MQKPVVNVMVKAARQAGSVILRHISKLDSLSVVEKSRQDYASEVDAAAEKEIIKELRRAYPDAAILAEESGAMGKGRQTFVVDPLDGTSNYLRGFPHFCVSIALVENGEPTDGVIYDPLRNELFTASKGAGALLNDKKLRIGERKDLTNSLLVTGIQPPDAYAIASRLGTSLRLEGHLEIDSNRVAERAAEREDETGQQGRLHGDTFFGAASP